MKSVKIVTKNLFLFICIMCSWNCFSQETENPVAPEKKETTTLEEPRKDLTYGFSLAVGGRFSFLDKSNDNDLYYDISAFYPTAFKVGKNKGINIGIDFGLYEAGLSGSPDQIRENKTINYIIINEPAFYRKVNEDSVLIVNRTFNRQATPSKSNGIGLYFSPTVQLSKKSYLLINFQHFYHNATRNFRDDIIQSDTMKVTWEHYNTLVETPPFSSFGSDRDEKSTSNRTFVGIGGIFFFDLGEASFRVKPMIGYEFSRFLVVGNTNLDTNYNDNWGKFFVDFRFIESKKFGIKIGGEIQGVIRKRGRSFVSPPSIYLSKIFSLDKIVEFLK
ncbi:MAG: hypothetical protein R2791_20495 [Saprospiraceae bacterium]